MTPATTWVTLEDTMLSEITQPPKGKCGMIPLSEAPSAVTATETERRMVGARAGGGELVFNGDSLGHP